MGHSAQTKAKIGNALRGKPKSAAHKAKLSAALTGQTLSASTKAKISAFHKGRKKSQATRNAMKAAWVKRKERMPATGRHNPERGYLYAFPTKCGGVKVGITTRPRARFQEHTSKGITAGRYYKWLSHKVDSPHQIEQDMLKQYDGERAGEIIYGYSAESLVVHMQQLLGARAS